MDDDFPDPLAVARRDLGERFSDLDKVESVTLKEGPRSKKIARFMTIKNRHTGEVHHHSLTIESGKKRQGSWELDDKRSVSLADDEVDEIGRLIAFVQAARGGAATTPSTPAAAPAASSADEPLAHGPGPDLTALTPTERADLLVALIAGLGNDRDGLRRLARLAKASPPGLGGVAAALDFGRYAAAVDALTRLLDEGASDGAIRGLLARQVWLLGDAYATWLDPTALGLELPPDVLLRQAANGDLTLVALKTSAGAHFEAGPHAPYPGNELAQALAGVMHHLDALDAWAPELARPDGARASRLDAMLVIRMPDDDASRETLRRFSAHFDRIEILTFDQLLGVGRQVLDTLKATIQRHVGRGGTEPG